MPSAATHNKTIETVKHTDDSRAKNEHKTRAASIIVSKTAYAALRLLKSSLDYAKKEFVPFPDGDYSKGQVVNELTKKNVIKKQGSHKTAVFCLAVPFEDVVESARKTKDMSGGTRAESKVSTVRESFKKLPTLHEISQFVGAVNAASKTLNKDRHDQLTSQIADLKSKLARATEDAEHRLLMDLNRLYHERRNLKGSVVIEAIKHVAAQSEFRAIDWSQIISLNINDYGSS